MKQLTKEREYILKLEEMKMKNEIKNNERRIEQTTIEIKNEMVMKNDNKTKTATENESEIQFKNEEITQKNAEVIEVNREMKVLSPGKFENLNTVKGRPLTKETGRKCDLAKLSTAHEEFDYKFLYESAEEDLKSTDERTDHFV